MKIEHLDQILPHVAGRPDFVVAKRDGYTVVDYVYADATTFDDPVRIECRGIKFGPDGKTLARPFGKFFNIGEKDHTQPHLLDFGSPHAITEKLDGSMIHPAVVDGALVFMTRMGRSGHAVVAERHLTPELEAQCRSALAGGVTPIFEWTAPDNRIVIRYEQSTLTLLAMRETISGDYLDRGDICQWADYAGGDVVPMLDSEWSDGHAFVEFARAISGAEGFVIRFASGLWVKAKGDDYVMKHRAKDSITLEKNALVVVLENGVDDVLPLLTPEDAADLERYRDAVAAGIACTARQIEDIVASGAGLDQKAFAVDHLRDVDPTLRPLAFAVRGGKPARDAVVATVLKNTATQARVDAIRQLFNARPAA